MGEVLTTSCAHPTEAECVYCPTCGVAYSLPRKPPTFVEIVFAPVAFLARVLAGPMATPELDLAACQEGLRSGDPKQIRRALGFLMGMAPRAWRVRSDVEPLLVHPDRDLALRARDLIATMRG